jgi:CBS domain-containing protein
MNVSQIMSQNVQFCRPADNLETAAGIMWNHDLGCLPVLSSTNEIVGMITDRDICMACYTQGLPPRNIRVSSVMSQAVYSCRPDETINDVVEKLSSYQVRRLPVLESDGKLVGMVSLQDLAREAEREIGLKKQEISAADVINTLAAICQPREVSVMSHH